MQPTFRCVFLGFCVSMGLGLQACGGGARSAPPASPTQPPPEPGPTPSAQPGLDARPVNSSCIAWARPSGTIRLERYSSLSFTAPIGMHQAPGDASRWYVVEQDGVIEWVNAASPTSTQTFVDISARVASVGDGAGWETGLLGMAFHPNFPADDRVFLSYTAAGPLRSIIAEFRLLAGDATRLDPNSERVLLTIQQPQNNHNGGHLAFGADGFLYIGMGDGGGAGDDDAGHGVIGNGQSLQTLLGKMLRIDVSDTSGAVRYRIPPTNPYANGAVCNTTGATSAAQCAEIYAYGFRNPWRWSFDRSTGELWMGDVGQGQWEEVNRVVLGGNYGWRCREGAHEYNTASCTMSGLIDPVAEYDHTQGQSITGGYVYRGAQDTGLVGRYLFADFSSGRIWAWIPEDAAQPREPTLLLDSDLSIASFAEGLDGELYVVDLNGGLYRVSFDAAGGESAPQLLSDTGCVSASDAKQPASGLIPYTINAPFWSDGAEKDRWLALPEGESITLAADGDFDLPVGAVVMKQFRSGSRLIETRLFMRHPDGAWGGFSYEWNAEQTNAALVADGAVRDLGDGQQWIFPSTAQCLECHTRAAGATLGLETSQLNRDFTYAATGRTANQLFTLSHIGVLTPAITNPSTQAMLPNPDDATTDLGARARAYLHTNCAQCHRPDGPTQSTMDLRYTTALAMTNTCNVAPQLGDLDLGANARLIAPGSAANSLIVNRMNRRDQHGMPPLASTQVDAAGVALITQWIDALTGC